MLSLVVRHVLYLPSQVIVNNGDIGHHMYYVTKGEVEVHNLNIFFCLRYSLLHGSLSAQMYTC